MLERISDEKLNSLSKDAVVLIYNQLFDSFIKLSEDNKAILEQSEKQQRQLEDLQEKLTILIQRKYGRSSEKSSQIEGQLSFDLETMEVLNEAEKLVEDLDTDDDFEEEEIVVKKKKHKGKKQEDLEGLPKDIVDHTLSDEKLSELFPEGYKRLPDEIYTRYDYKPSEVKVVEHHIAVYASKGKDGKIVKADRPGKLLRNSLASPAMVAAVMQGKFVNALPLNRIANDFQVRGINISRQNLARWIIKVAELYLVKIYNAMRDEMIRSAQLIHCDETPFKVVVECKTRGPNAKCFMWVYHTSEKYKSRDIYIYEYQPSRNSEHPREFLKGYSGILVTDGFQVYHTVAGERPNELTVAGCWSHAKRKYAEIIKSLGKKSETGSAAAKAHRKIQAIYHVEHMADVKDEKAHLEHRQSSVKPLVDDYFDWVKDTIKKADAGSSLYQALNYSLNQEQFLREFLNNPLIPLDNNDAERSIRKFCVGKHSWHLVESTKGAQASAIMYSIAETARANNLQPYEYFKYVLQEFEKSECDPTREQIQNLLPWSESLPDECRSKRKTQEQ